MKLYYLFLLVMFFLFNSCVEQTPRTKSVAPISVRDTTKRTSRSHLWNSNTSTYKKTKSSYTPSKKTYKRKSSYKSITICSTAIRKWVDDGKIILPFVTDEVNSIIRKLGLYK